MIYIKEEWLDELSECEDEPCLIALLSHFLGGSYNVGVRSLLVVDILIKNKIAIEVKYLRGKSRRKFYEGIGQALAYHYILKFESVLIQFYDSLHRDILDMLKILAENLPIEIIAIELPTKKIYYL